MGGSLRSSCPSFPPVNSSASQEPISRPTNPEQMFSVRSSAMPCHAKDSWRVSCFDLESSQSQSHPGHTGWRGEPDLSDGKEKSRRVSSLKAPSDSRRRPYKTQPLLKDWNATCAYFLWRCCLERACRGQDWKSEQMSIKKKKGEVKRKTSRVRLPTFQSVTTTVTWTTAWCEAGQQPQQMRFVSMLQKKKVHLLIPVQKHKSGPCKFFFWSVDNPALEVANSRNCLLLFAIVNSGEWLIRASCFVELLQHRAACHDHSENRMCYSEKEGAIPIIRPKWCFNS